MKWNGTYVPCPADPYLDLYSICSFDKPFKILTRIKRGLRVNSVSFTKVVISSECRRLSRPVNHMGMSSRDVQCVSYIPFPRNARKMPLNCNNNINNPFPLPLFFQETTHGGGQGQGQGGQGQQRES